jgi:5'/3'-nucleotidase SurE
MKIKFRVSVVMLMFLCLVLLPGRFLAGEPLNILITNDDGYDAPGIQYLRGALLAAGHNVTVVAPLENRSGSGGSSAAEDFIEVLQQEPGVWSVDGTPTDSVVAGLDVVLTNPPDLIISGLNFGQNLGRIASFGSGTIGAALTGLTRNIPSIAASVGIKLEEMDETPVPFPSTFASFPLAAEYMVRLVNRLDTERKPGAPLLPANVVLNIVFPVPYTDIKGQRFTRIGHKSLGHLKFVDIDGVIPNGGGLVVVSAEMHQPPDPVPDADNTAYWDGYISITIMDGDMTAEDSLVKRINKLKRCLDDIPLY